MTRETSNVPMSIKERLQAKAQDLAAKISAGGAGRVRMNGNRSFTTPDNIEGDSLEVVIIDFITTNMYYDTGYQRDNPNPPACFAIGSNPSTLQPSANSPDAQSTDCATCPMNQFGSNGKGKACSNRKLLAVTPAASLLSDETPPIWLLSVSPTSIKIFDRYVSDLATKYETAPIGVVTEITLDTEKTWAAPKFRIARVCTDEEIGKAFDLEVMSQTTLEQEPDVSGYTPPKPGRR